MIVLLTGCTHTGKTKTAQKLLERYQYPYLSIDLLKMGLIRSGYCSLSPTSEDAELQAVLWPIVREIIHTAIENKQNLIVEGCYIPFTYREDFSEAELHEIQYLCLLFSRSYIETKYEDILRYEDVIEKRLISHDITKEQLFLENAYYEKQCERYGCTMYLIDQTYDVEITLQSTKEDEYDTKGRNAGY